MIFSGNSWKSSSSEGSRDMQPFLQNSHNATPTSQSGEMPKYLELLADNEDIILKENSTNGYEVPRSIHISDQNLANTNKASTNIDVKSNLHSDASQEQKDIVSSDIKEQLEKKCDKRSSISSLNLPERKRASITNMTEKCNTLDSSKLTNPTIKAILKRDSFTSLTDQRKNKRNVIERRGSEISLEGRSSSSLSSNISLAPPTRPSSSLISSQNVLPLKNCIIGGTGESTDNVAKNTLPKIQRTHSNLQSGKANIPLVINSALLNLLRQTPVVEDSNNIVTYTNINTDAVRVNGS